VCREARGGACVMYREMGADEEYSVDGRRNETQGSSAQNSMQGAERVRETACAQGSNAGECKTCGATIGADTYCSACNGENYAPVDGVCVDASTSPGNTFCTKGSSGTCSACKGASFMYKGGCYQTGNQNPGNTLCTTASEGKCTKAAEGYFVPPGATADKQSVISCSESTPVTLADGKQYKGVSNCLVCTAPTTTESTPNLAVCTTCTDGKYGSDCAGTCHLDCKTCAGGNTNDKCTSCKSTGKTYFKKGDGETGECVEKASCNGSYFPTTM
ncbi:Kinesin-like protein KIP3, partial [Giardia duodenalis]